MTTPTGAADERERLQVLLAKYIGDSKYLLPVFEATNILHAMSADAETIFELQTRISCRDADIDVMQEELAALRKDAERIMDGVQSAIGYFEPLYKQDRRIIGLSIVLNRLYAILERDALAAHGADTQGYKEPSEAQMFGGDLYSGIKP